MLINFNSPYIEWRNLERNLETHINLIDKSWLLCLEIKNKTYSKFLVEKASISINGVSLTISKVKKNYLYLNIIPHTLKLTNLKYIKANDLVNVELDIFSKYLYKYSS